MMEDWQKKALRDNYNYLRGTTVNIEDLCLYMHRAGVLTESDYAYLGMTDMSREGSKAKCSQLYITVARKGPDAFHVLCKGLQATENIHILKVLLNGHTEHFLDSSHNYTSPLLGDFQITENGPNAIKDIILTDFSLLERWQDMVPAFLEHACDQVLIENELRIKDHRGVTVKNTLELWVSKHGSSATFITCKNIFSRHDWIHTAENMELHKEMIWTACQRPKEPIYSNTNTPVIFPATATNIDMTQVEHSSSSIGNPKLVSFSIPQIPFSYYSISLIVVVVILF